MSLFGGGDSGGGGALGMIAQLLDPLGLFGKKGGGAAGGESMQSVARPTPQGGPPMQLAGQSAAPVGFVKPPMRGGMGASAPDLQALLAMLMQQGGGGGGMGGVGGAGGQQ